MRRLLLWGSGHLPCLPPLSHAALLQTGECLSSTDTCLLYPVYCLPENLASQSGTCWQIERLLAEQNSGHVIKAWLAKVRHMLVSLVGSQFT